MNFLGHFLLAGNDEGLVVGNFIADFVKGKAYRDFPPPIAKGILMHREIDFFTDSHSDFKQSKRTINEKHGHYSGVIIDIFYDHFLAADFEKIGGEPLDDFSEKCYRVIEKYREVIPETSRIMFGYMRRDNWLKRYAEIGGIEKTLYGMSKRIKRDNKLDEAVADLRLHYEKMKADFDHFITDALEYFG